MKSKVLEHEQLMIQINKNIDDKLKLPISSDIIQLKKYIDTNDTIKAFDKRKEIYLSEMNTIDWIAYYNTLPYHDEIHIMINGKYVVIPKKI